eukprot:COSAG02_NODE_189_length_30109_cov_71.135855_2_plen_222_part_00
MRALVGLLVHASILARAPAGAVEWARASAEQNEAIAQALQQICEVNPNATMCPEACTNKFYQEQQDSCSQLTRDMRLHGRAGEACPDWSFLCCNPACLVPLGEISEIYPSDSACSDRNLVELSKASGEITDEQHAEITGYMVTSMSTFSQVDRSKYCSRETPLVCLQSIGSEIDCVERKQPSSNVGQCHCWNETATPCGQTGMEWKGVDCSHGSEQFTWSL